MARLIVAQSFSLPLDAVMNMGAPKFAAHVALLELQAEAGKVRR